jgi:hypothetical protein
MKSYRFDLSLLAILLALQTVLIVCCRVSQS